MTEEERNMILTFCEKVYFRIFKLSFMFRLTHVLAYEDALFPFISAVINFLFIYFFQRKTFSDGKELGSLYIVHFYEVFIVQ